MQEGGTQRERGGEKGADLSSNMQISGKKKKKKERRNYELNKPHQSSHSSFWFIPGSLWGRDAHLSFKKTKQKQNKTKTAGWEKFFDLCLLYQPFSFNFFAFSSRLCDAGSSLRLWCLASTLKIAMNHRWLFSGPTMLHIISFTSQPTFFMLLFSVRRQAFPPACAAFSVALLFFLFLEHLDVELLLLIFFVKSEGKDQSPLPPMLLSMKHYMYDNEKRQ